MRSRLVAPSTLASFATDLLLFLYRTLLRAFNIARTHSLTHDSESVVDSTDLLTALVLHFYIRVSDEMSTTLNLR